MKKNPLKMNDCHAKNSEKCPDQISVYGVYPPLFSSCTWTECAPISVKYLILITNIQQLNVFKLRFYDIKT